MAPRKNTSSPSRSPSRRSSGKTGARRAGSGRAAAPRRSAAPRRPAAKRRPAAARRATRKVADAGRGVLADVPNGIGLRAGVFEFESHAAKDVRRFYQELLGFTDVVDEPEGGMTVRVGHAWFLSFHPPVAGPPEEWRPPREPAVAFYVTDVDRAYRDLIARGATFDQDPVNLPDGRRVAVLQDPEGRIVMLIRGRRD
jgi:predicted enzyme related to lactoylglutathione lyase